MTPKNLMKCLSGLAVLALAAGCSTTSMLSVWKKPGTGPLEFKKVAVIAPVKDASLRRSVEDQVVGSLKMGHSVPSYTLFGPNKISDPPAVKAALREQGFDGAVVIRIASVDQESSWVPGTGYGFGAWPMYDPG